MGGMGWILFVEDVLSRYCWATPLKRKTGEETARGMKLLFDQVQADPTRHHRLPSDIYVDQGSEFYNRNVKDLLNSYHTPPILKSGKSTMKAALVERLQRTIKTRLYKHFYETGSYRWVDVLDPLVQSYNHAYHSTLKRTPASVNRGNEEDVHTTLYGKWEALREAALTNKHHFKFQVGDVVRMSRQVSLFTKGYLPQWTEEWFKIRARDRGPPPYYRLEEYGGKDIEAEIIEGTFYEPELQKVNVTEQSTMQFRIEKVLQRKTDPDTQQKVVLVKYKGWPDKYSEWISASQVESLKDDPST